MKHLTKREGDDMLLLIHEPGETAFEFPVHDHSFFEIFIMTEGCLNHHVNGGIQHLTKGNIVLMRPFDAHCYAYVGGTEGRFLNIEIPDALMTAALTFLGPGYAPEFLFRGGMPRVGMPEPVSSQLLVQWARNYMEMQKSAKPEQLLAEARSLLCLLLVRGFPAETLPEEDRWPVWFSELLMKTRRPEILQEGVSAIYRATAMSEGHVVRTFQRYLGRAPVQYLAELRLQHARNLLITTELSVLQIALEAGFENMSHFHRIFRESSGMTPLKYRRHFESSAAGWSE